MTKKVLLVTFSTIFFLLFHLEIKVSKMSEKFKLDRKIGFQNTFDTKCINVKIDSIGRSIILRSINTTYNCHGCADREKIVRGVQFRPPFFVFSL